MWGWEWREAVEVTARVVATEAAAHVVTNAAAARAKTRVLGEGGTAAAGGG